jgi:hypothetical protein
VGYQYAAAKKKMANNEEVCPHCGQRVLIRYGVPLSPKLADIFDAVERAGRFGISKEELTVMFFASLSKKTLFVSIKHINDRFEWLESPIRIKSMGYGLPYRIEGIE